MQSQTLEEMIMAKILASSLLAVSLSLVLIPSAHAFGIKALFNNKVDNTEMSDLSDSLPFLVSALNKQSSTATTPSTEQFSVSDAAVSQQVTSVTPQATTVVTEGFEDISTLSAKGWAFQNNSSPPPATTTATANWNQAGDTFTVAQAGPADSYISVSDNTSASGSGQLSNWLITPELDFSVTNAITFFTRTFQGTPNPESLEVRLSISGASIDVGNDVSSVGVFTTLLQAIGSTTIPLAYPGALGNTESNKYQQFTLNLGKQSGSGRVAFRVNSLTGIDVTGNPTLVAIDSVSYSVPEPAMASSLSGFAVLGLVQFFKSKRKQA
jgi:hypothetical protein